MGAEHLAQSVVKQVGGRVVGGDGGTAFPVDGSNKFTLDIFGQFLCQMHCHSVFALGVVDLDSLASAYGRQRSCVADLTAHLGVER